MHPRSFAAMIFLTLFVFTASAQSKEHYAKLAKRQTTWGLIVAGTVPVFTILGLVIDDPNTPGYPVTVTNESSPKASLFITAGAAAVVSTILLVSGSKNRKRAASMAIGQRSLNGVYTFNGSIRTQATLSLNIPLR